MSTLQSVNIHTVLLSPDTFLSWTIATPNNNGKNIIPLPKLGFKAVYASIEQTRYRHKWLASIVLSFIGGRAAKI